MRDSFCTLLALGIGLVALSSGPAAAQSGRVVRIGTISDGPWDRSQEIRISVERLIKSRLGAEYTVIFPPEKRLQGDWTAAGAYEAVSRLLADSSVDVVITLGMLSSYDLVRRGPLPKPGIATQVLEPDLLFVAYQWDPATRKRISTVPNLSYITVPGQALRLRIEQFRKLTRFDHITFLMMEAMQDLFPDFDDAVSQAMGDLKIPFKIVLVGHSLSRTVAALPEEPTAVMMTPMPQLEPEDFKKLIRVLNDMAVPTFMLGSRGEVRQGVLAGSRPLEEFTQVANRVATNLKAILNGTPAADLPIDLELEEKLAINLETAASLGIVPPVTLMAEAEIVDTTEIALVASPSLAAVVDDDTPQLNRPGTRPIADAARRMQDEVHDRVGRTLNGLGRYSVFDSISYRFEEDRLILLGYVWGAALKEDAQEAVRSLPGVEVVENFIEVLPLSVTDDRLRAMAYEAIYTNETLIRYAPGGGFAHFDENQDPVDLSAGLRASDLPIGPHPIHILVRNGNIALVGAVEREAHRRIAERQARQVSGAFSVENYLQVRTP